LETGWRVNRSILKRVPLKAECFAPDAPAPALIARYGTSLCRALCFTVLLIIVGRPVGSSAQQQDVVDRQLEPAAANSVADSGAKDSGAAAANKGATPDPAMSDKTGSDKAGPDKSILDLDIDQLGKIPAKVPTAFDTEVTTVTANKSSVGKSAAAVFVVTSEMIRRSGATCIPECLRMVPGLQVAKVGSSQWAISSRGFNSDFSTKLLVLIDGRTVYNPLFGGVFWDTQDVVLQDIDRIEVIRGPGSTIWGANAVNGVINIITKTAADTQGLQVIAGGGNQNKTISSIRYGGKIGENTDYRLYVKEQDQAAGFNPQQGSANDAWNQVRGGFRIDSQTPSKTDAFTLQGDIYTGAFGEQTPTPLLTPPFVAVPADTFHVGGGDVLGRWTHVVDENNTYFVQTYYDQIQRTSPFLDIRIDTWDIQFQQNLKHAGNRTFTWGAGYRLISDDYPSVDHFGSLNPQALTYDQANVFLQEETPLFRDDLKFTVGSKFMYYFFTGFEYQPSARLLWEIDDKQVIWGAVSRAVRTPVRIEEDANITLVATQNPTVFTLLEGAGRTLNSEELTAFELGYRRQVNERLSFELATFYNIYDNLIAAQVIGIQPGVPPTAVAQYQNSQSAQTTGFELNGQWKIDDTWRLQGWYSFLYMQVDGPGGAKVPGNSPMNQAYLMSSWDLPCKFEFDLMPRYVQNLPTLNVPSYATMDARLGWRPNESWEFSITGQNLLQSHHLEFVGQTTMLSEVNRGVYAQIVFRH
jgi:iron complex outermembrane receptor protein